MPVSDLAEISSRLKPKKVNVTDILLDPNNPRLAEIGGQEPEEGIDEDRVQEDAFRRLKEEVGIDDLRSSIATVGFLPISMLVVRKHLKDGSNKYVVIEGNRRIAAIKWILREAPPGITRDIINERRNQLTELDVIELETDLNQLERDRFLL
ncbi:hypothetical protein CW712_05640 [Candidatus Bathyarchaeota archaeon]|nr:MAG: hypothetical protein CW712_05640 [Candidatus Bathyarchaeota archaeon]